MPVVDYYRERNKVVEIDSSPRSTRCTPLSSVRLTLVYPRGVLRMSKKNDRFMVEGIVSRVVLS